MQLHQVVAADVLDDTTAGGCQLAVGQSHADANEKIARRPEAQAQRPGPSGRQQSADRVAGRVEWIKRKKLARLRQLRLQRLQGDPGLDAHHHVRLRVLDHAVEEGRVQEHICPFGRIAHSACPAATDREHRQLCFGGFVQAARQLFSCGRLLDRRFRFTGSPRTHGEASEFVGFCHHHFASMASPVLPARWTGLREGSGKILPGLRMPSASKTSFTRCIASRSSSL